MLLAHRAMVRDLDRIGRTADQLAASPDPARTAALKSYAERIYAIIEHHHRGEDEMLWPKLRAGGAGEDVLALMAGEHEQLNAALHAWHSAIGALGADGTGATELSARTGEVRELLVQHTSDEERELLDRLAPALTEQIWKKFEMGMVRTAPLWTLRFMPPWLSSVAEPSERGGVPAPPMVKMFSGWLERKQREAFGDNY
jgi:hemerythrin-like domain-containing protein